VRYRVGVTAQQVVRVFSEDAVIQATRDGICIGEIGFVGRDQIAEDLRRPIAAKAAKNRRLVEPPPRLPGAARIAAMAILSISGVLSILPVNSVG